MNDIHVHTTFKGRIECKQCGPWIPHPHKTYPCECGDLYIADDFCLLCFLCPMCCEHTFENPGVLDANH